MMNVTGESSTIAMKTSFGPQLKHICQVFRFYSSIILVVVGKDLLAGVWNPSLVGRNDWLVALDQGLFFDEDPTQFLQ